MCEVSRFSGINLVKTGPGLFAQSFGRSTKADKLPALADGNKTAMAMPTSYNQIAGQSAERLAALSDGVFAVAMTLLLLKLHAQSFGRSTKADKLPALADGNKTAMAMPTSYNQIAGQSAERLAALSDGVFAVAMTLLLLE